MNENLCSNNEIQMLFEHVFYLDNAQNEPRILHDVIQKVLRSRCDHFNNAFVAKNIATGYDVVVTLQCI